MVIVIVVSWQTNVVCHTIFVSCGMIYNAHWISLLFKNVLVLCDVHYIAEMGLNINRIQEYDFSGSW